MTTEANLQIQSCCCTKLLQSCPALCNPIDSSLASSCPWDSPGKNTGVGCHFLLQCMKVKSASEVAQSCLTLCDPMDCSLPGSSAQGIFQARVLECGLNEELLILKYSLRKGKRRFYRGEPDPGWCFYPQWNAVFFERLWFRSVYETFIDHYLGKLVYLQGTELSLVGNTKN